MTQKLEAGTSLLEATKDLKAVPRMTAWFTQDGPLAEFKKSQNVAEALAEKHLTQWAGPFFLDGKQAIFQVVEEQPRPLDLKRYEKDREKLQSMLMDVKQDLWLKEFLTTQRKVLKVRIYMDTTGS